MGSRVYHNLEAKYNSTFNESLSKNELLYLIHFLPQAQFASVFFFFIICNLSFIHTTAFARVIAACNSHEPSRLHLLILFFECSRSA